MRQSSCRAGFIIIANLKVERHFIVRSLIFFSFVVCLGARRSNHQRVGRPSTTGQCEGGPLVVITEALFESCRDILDLRTSNM